MSGDVGMAGWAVTRLRYQARLNPTPPATIRAETAMEVTFLAMESIGEDGFVRKDQERAVGELLTGYSYFENSDLIVAKVTPCFENGKAALLSGLPAGVGFGTTEVTVLRPRPSLDGRFLYYLSREDRFMQGGVAAMTGAGGLKRVPDSYIRDYTFGLPAVDRQRQIATYLDAHTAKIDALIEKQKRLIEMLAERRQAVISHAVTKGLDPNTEMKDSGHDWVGSIPVDWSAAPFVRLTEGRVDYRGATPTKTTDGVQLITARNVKRGYIDREASREYVSVEDYAEVMRRGVPQIGDLLLTMEAPLGNVALVDDVRIALAQRVIKFRLDRSKLLPAFANYLLNGLRFQEQILSKATGSTALGLKASKLIELYVALPPLPEQPAIIAHLDRETAQIDALAAKAREMIDVLKERRQALISAAVTGKIDVRGLA